MNLIERIWLFKEVIIPLIIFIGFLIYLGVLYIKD
jgi:hypothetical protein